MLRLCTILIAGLVYVSSSQPSSSSNIPDKYDILIMGSVQKYWPSSVDWHWWKAQLYQESLLKPDAVSPVGARGLAQFMPPTWAEVSRQLRLNGASAHAVGPSIMAGAYYMARQSRQWSAPRPQVDRWDLGRASYNAGLGNLLKAQRMCGGVNLYKDIIRCLPSITGHNSKETITYVKRIHKYYGRMTDGISN